MPKFFHYFWVIILIIYILSPLDVITPSILDDLIAAGVLLYLLSRNAGIMKKRESYSQNHDHGQRGDSKSPPGSLTLDDSFRILGVSPDTPWEEVKKAYRDKVSKSHPDKVSHLGEELQEKAGEITLKLNAAMNMIRKDRGN
jgi:DnaJ-domain-containing protein 1